MAYLGMLSMSIIRGDLGTTKQILEAVSLERRGLVSQQIRILLHLAMLDHDVSETMKTQGNYL